MRLWIPCEAVHWQRRCWLTAGCVVRLINPRFMKPFVKGSKNDAVSAGAIFEAAMRPAMRFVPVKSRNQQDLQSLHRARERLICQRTALIKHTRGPRRIWDRAAARPVALYGAGTDRHRQCRSVRPVRPGASDLRRPAGPTRQPRSSDYELDATIVGFCRTNEACRRLAKLSGPVVATAIVAAVTDGRQFRSGREMAAWIELVPRQ